MKKYLIPLILLIVLVATPVLAVQNNQALIRSLQLRIQQLTLQLQKLLALQPISVSVPTSWQTYSDNGVTFKYPDSLAPACADLQKPSVAVNSTGGNNVDKIVCSGGPQGNKKITLNGLSFCLTTSGDVGAGQVYNGYYYATIKDNNYYTLKYVVHTSNGCGVYEPGSTKYKECMVCSAKYASVVPSLIEKSVGTLKFNDSKIPPSIALRSGPNNLKVGDSGTWQILEFYPANTTDKLSYYSVWGDETVIPNVFKYVGANNASGADNGSKFIHAYQKAGTYHPTFTAVNQYGQSSQVSSTVSVGNISSPSVTILSPNGGEKLTRGQTYEIKWSSQGSGLPTYSSIDVTDFSNPQRLRGDKITTKALTASGSYLWKVPSGSDIVVPGNMYRVAVVLGGSGSNFDESDSYFSVVESSSKPSLTISSPNGGERFTSGQILNIKWAATGLSINDKVHLMLFLPSTCATCGSKQFDITPFGGEAPALDGNYNWVIPSRLPASNSYKVSIILKKNTDNIYANDVSDNYFSIVTP